MIELERIRGMEIKAEEEPKGETLVGSGGGALRPPGMNIISFPNKFSLLLDESGQQPLFFIVFLHQELFGH